METIKSISSHKSSMKLLLRSNNSHSGNEFCHTRREIRRVAAVVYEIAMSNVFFTLTVKSISGQNLTWQRPQNAILLLFNPLRLSFQRINFRAQLMVCPLCVIVDDYHVKQMAPLCFHFASCCNDLFKFILL